MSEYIGFYVCLIVVCITLIIFAVAFKYLLRILGVNAELIDEFQWKLINDVVVTAVRFAEQTISGAGQGKKKKLVVTSLVTQWLQKYKLEINEDEMSALIEAAVFDMNTGLDNLN